jgi:hypothetical protein
VPLIAGGLDLANRFLRHPIVTGDQLRLARHNAFFDSGKAVTELGYCILPFRPAAERGYHWYVDHGYLTLRSNYGPLYQSLRIY